MQSIDKRRSVDLLVEQFWKNGYFTLSRKYGTYLPEPKRMGEFDIDIIARYKKDYAIGICLTEDDLDSEALKNKLSFLATRQTKTSNKRVLLFVGIPEELIKKTKMVLDNLDSTIKKNVKLFPIVEKTLPNIYKHKKDRYFS